jgi:hypothetical protein
MPDQVPAVQRVIGRGGTRLDGRGARRLVKFGGDDTVTMLISQQDTDRRL